MPPPDEKKPKAAPIVPPPPADKREPFEVIAERRKTERWLWRAMAAYAKWAIGREVTEAEFVATENAVLGIEIHPFPPAKK